MIDTNTVYEVIIPKPGLPNNEFSVVNADSPERAAEVVRILLACNDDTVTWVRVNVHPKID